MKTIIIILLIFLFGCTAPQSVIKIGKYIDKYETVVDGHKIFMVKYYTKEGEPAEKILYRLSDLVKDAPFPYEDEE